MACSLLVLHCPLTPPETEMFACRCLFTVPESAACKRLCANMTSKKTCSSHPVHSSRPPPVFTFTNRPGSQTWTMRLMLLPGPPGRGRPAAVAALCYLQTWLDSRRQGSRRGYRPAGPLSTRWVTLNSQSNSRISGLMQGFSGHKDSTEQFTGAC